MVLAGFLFVEGCGKKNALTVYTSVDRDYSESIITAFQNANPEIEVNVKYDSELSKTTGLYNLILQEMNNPQADVFWNSEIIRTIQLKNKGALTPYLSPSAKEIPVQYKNPDGYWTGFSARVRVMIINTEKVPETETPASIPDLTRPEYRGKTCMATPQFGTTAAHLVAVYTLLGETKATAQFWNLNYHRVKVFPGNATVKNEVARGAMAYGLTDTDDFFAALDEGKPVRMALLGQGKNGHGTLVIPNTVCLIKNSPHPENGKQFIDYLLSPAVEEKLAQSRARQIPLRDSVPRPEGVPDLSTIKVMPVEYSQIAENIEPCLAHLRKTIR